MNMICDFCHEREAVIFMEQTSSDGSKRKVHICMDCALDRGITSNSRSIEQSIGSLFKELALAAKRMDEVNSKMCPVCGTSLGSIKKSLRTGCPECYEIFKDEIKKLLVQKGVSQSYTGSMPSRLAGVHSVLNDRIALQNKLNDAIQNEDYEKAAMYRDYLKALKKSAVSSGGDGDENSDS